MYKIHCLNAISEKGTSIMKDEYEFTKEIGEADGILVRSAAMHDMEVSDNLLAVARAGAGVNNIPLDKYAKEGIVVFNTPGANANAVKELVLAALLYSSRDIHGGIEWVRANTEDEAIAKSVEKAKKQFAGHEIMGKTLAVIGLGAIGVLVANAAADLGMHVIGYDPFLSVGNAWKLSGKVEYSKDLCSMLSVSDFATIHVPASPKTNGMVGAKEIAAMKEGLIFLNFARDTLVDEAAMAEALESGRVAKYVTDFANPLSVKMKNAIVTPHLGASTEESEENCAVMAAQELMDYLQNGNITHSVNYPDCDFGPITTPCRIAVLNSNIPSMISQFSSILARNGINIVDMTNKSRGEYAYTLMNPDVDVSDDIIPELEAIDGVHKARIIRR